MIKSYVITAASFVLLSLMTSVSMAMTISQAKMQPNSSVVSFAGAITFANGSVYVVEDPNRSCAIKVFWPGALVSEGAMVNVTGTVAVTTLGEACVNASNVQKTGSANLTPFLTYGKRLGGGDFFYNPGPPERGQRGVFGGKGVNNIGMLVKIYGTVTAVEPKPSSGKPPYFWVDDGSGVGVGSYRGICVVQSQPLDLQVGDRVYLTGVSTCYKDSEGKLRPAVQMLSVEPIFPARPYFAGGGSAGDGGKMVMFTPVRDAVDYRLYESFDSGVTYSQRPETSVAMSNQLRIILLNIPTNRLLRVVPVNSSGVEGNPSHIINAKVDDPRDQLIFTSPVSNQTNVSRVPTFTWNSIPDEDAELVMISVQSQSAKGPTVWSTTALFNTNSITYGNYRGTYWQLLLATGPLEPNTKYWVYAAAFNSERWQKVRANDTPFTTGP